MLFFLSKIFWLLAQPLSLASILVLASLVVLLFGLRRLAIAGLLPAALILFVTLYTSAGTVALQTLEDVFSRPSPPPAEVACMIVLGGAIEAEVMAARGNVEFNQAADRFVEAARLARVYPQAKILVSGGDGSFSGRYQGDAAASEQFFADQGIDVARLIREDASRTTGENVSNSATLLSGMPPCLLITSAFHMPRAVGLFRKAGIETVPWPTDYRTSGKATLGLDFTQPLSNSQLTTTAVREWLGLLVYRLTGQTSQVLPRP